MYPRETLRFLESLNLDKESSDKIFYKNLERITGRKLVK
jgi:predicted TIM-barrel fold metal-dependent hydrolase